MGRLIYTDPSGQELSVPLGPSFPVVSIGRAMDCTIRSNRKSVSRHHAEFRYNNGRYEVFDNGSSNGTYLIVNEERRQIHATQQINHSDEVWCGDFILRFYDEPEDVDSTMERSSLDYQPGANAQEADMFGAGRPTYDFGGGPAARPSYNQSFDPAGFDQGFNAPGFSNDLEPGGAFGSTPAPSPSGSAAPSFNSRPFEAQGFDAYQDLSPDLIEIEPGVVEELERLREEKVSIEELALRQAYELDELRNRLEEKEGELERVRDELDDRAMRTMTAPADIDRIQGDLQAAQSEKLRLIADLEESHRRLEELERAQDALEEQGLMTVAAPGNIQSLAIEIESIKEENRRLSEERDEGQHKLGELEGRLDEAYRKIDELRATQPTGTDPEVAKLKIELGRKQEDIKVLEQQLEHMQVQVKDQVQAAQSDKATDAQLAGLRKEIERQGRLLEEFDQTRRDLKTELDQECETTASLRATVEEYEEKLDEFEAQEQAHQKTLAELNARLKEAEIEGGAARASLQAQKAAFEAQKAAGEAHEGEVRDLKNEIEGLKMRLKMEKERNKNDEGLAADNDALRSQIGSLEERIAATAAQLEELQRAHEATVCELATARESVKLSQAISPGFFTDLHARIDTLDRIMDAIERTDLQPLSTVDRIRLQSAIRDTKPKKTLEDLRGMVQGQVESVSAE